MQAFSGFETHAWNWETRGGDRERRRLVEEPGVVGAGAGAPVLSIFSLGDKNCYLSFTSPEGAKGQG